jgi:hypothetical protein
LSDQLLNKVILGGVGLFVIAKARPEKFYSPTFAVAAILTVISFGGWWWTEIIYDLQVINSVPKLHDDAPLADRKPSFLRSGPPSPVDYRIDLTRLSHFAAIFPARQGVNLLPAIPIF